MIKEIKETIYDTLKLIGLVFGVIFAVVTFPYTYFKNKKEYKKLEDLK